MVAQSLERPQQDRQALALDRLTDEQDPQLALRIGVLGARSRIAA